MPPMTHDFTAQTPTERDHMADVEAHQTNARTAARKQRAELAAAGVLYGPALRHTLESSAEHITDQYSEAVYAAKAEVARLGGIAQVEHRQMLEASRINTDLRTVLIAALADVDRRKPKAEPEWVAAARALIIGDEAP